MKRLVLPALLLLVGCPPVPADDDDSAEPQGPVEVVGGGYFDTIQDAVDAAPDGGVVLVAPGCYDEWLFIDKPLSIRGDGADRVILTGGGAGTAVTVDQVAGSVSLQDFLVMVPHDSLATTRATRITDSAQVTLSGMGVRFEEAVDAGRDPDFCTRIFDGQAGGNCDRGAIGVEISRSGVTINETDIVCTGFLAESGGVGVLAQSDSTLLVNDSLIGLAGSFGIRGIDSAIQVAGSEIVSINRDPNAQDGESNGSGLFVEETTQTVVVEDTSFDNGSFVGIWSQGASVEVSNSTFSNFSYGVVVTGDTASAAGRRMSIAGSTFTDLRVGALFSSASTTITASTFETLETTVLPTTGAIGYGGAQLLGAGTTHEISGNTFRRLGVRGAGVYGSNADGNAALVRFIGNTVEGIVGGNGLDAQLVDEAVITDNIVSAVDHVLNDQDGDGNSDGANTGFGIDCFLVDSCTLERNDVRDSEFGNYVFVQAGFSSLDDVSTGGLLRGLHFERSQGTLTNPTVTDAAGLAIFGLDSSLVGSGGAVRGTRRGLSINDFDNVDDPEEGAGLLISGGIALQWQSGGAPAYLSWTEGTFEDNIDGALFTIDSQVDVQASTFTDNGRPDEIAFDDNTTITYSPNPVVYLLRNDSSALTGPTLRGNVFDGGTSSYGVQVSDGPRATIDGNTFCAGTSAGLYLRDSAGATVSDNVIGHAGAAVGTQFCADIDWTRALFIAGNYVSALGDPVVVNDNDLAAPTQDYALYVTGVGSTEARGNNLGASTTAAIYASMGLPSDFTLDGDGDGGRPYSGDCDDTDPDVGAIGAVEIPGDGKDNDCDGVADDGTDESDADADGFSILDGDCNDTDAAIHPDQIEDPANQRDDNCDGWADLDGDVHPATVVLGEGNTVDGSAQLARLYGGTVQIPEPGAGETASTFTNLGSGFDIDNWQYSSSPLRAVGTLEIGAGHTVQSVGTCVDVGPTDSRATLDDVTLDGCTTGVFVAGLGEATLTDVTLSNPGGYLLQNGGLATLTDVSVDGGNGVSTVGGVLTASGVELANTSDGLFVSGGEVSWDGGSISGTLGSAVNVAFGTATLSGAVISGAGASGISATGGTLSVSGGAVNDSTGPLVSVSGSAVVDLNAVPLSTGGSPGVSLLGGELSLTDGSLLLTTGAGIGASAGVLTVDGTLIDLTDGDAIALSGTVQAAISGVTLLNAGGWGLSCDGGAADPTTSTVTLDPCEADDALDNAAGDFLLENGCELVATCSIVP